MELDAHHESQHGFHESQHGFSDSQHDYPESQHDYPESQHGYPESQHGCPESQHGGQNGLGSHSKVLDSEVAQEIRYLDQVLEANGCDGSTDGPTNGTSTPECSEVHIDGSSPSVFVSGMTPPSGEEVRVEGGRQTTFVDTEVNPSNGHSADSSFSSSSSFSSTSSFSSAKKEAPRFELRAFQEERKPSRLFETPTEKEVQVKKVRPSEEMLELERERLELIRGQAVKKNPGIATKWWNPPQERTLEEELDPEQLDSHRKYQQRKQQRSQAPGYAHMASQPPVVTFDLPETTSGEDVVVEQIDFLAARKQFLQSEQAKQGGGTRRDVAPQIYSAKPFSVSTGNRARSPLAEPGDVTTAQMERINYSSEESPPPGKSHMTWAEEGGGDFTCARAVMTILREEDSEGRAQPLGSSYHLEEFDSGLDELSLRSQDTAVLETLSNDLSLDTVSDQDALSLPPTPQPTTPVNGRLEPGPLAPPGYAGPSEAELEYHAGILVQNAIQQALVSQEQDWPPSHSLLSPTHTLPSSMPSPQTQSSPLSSPQTQSSPLPLTSPSPSFPSTSPLPASSTHQPPPDKLSVTLSPNPHQSPTTSPPAQRPSPGPERREGGPRIRVQSSYARALAAAPDPTPAPAPAVAPAPSRPTQPYPAPPSSPPREKQEFSYFSKYSEAAELRSTAATHAPEAETSAGPFRLRSRKQKTLSVIEAEIRAAQEREEELKKQRQTLGVRPAPGHAPGNRQTQRVTISPGDKMKTNSLPARLTLTSRTAPGKIEKIRPAPPVSPSSSEGPPASPLSDQGSDDSGGRPKNFMQTLMEDYETHKVKRRDKQEDNSYARLLLASEVTTEVLEATRVTRRKSNMALKWEAGIYANQDEGEEEEEEEEEEE